MDEWVWCCWLQEERRKKKWGEDVWLVSLKQHGVLDGQVGGSGASAAKRLTRSNRPFVLVLHEKRKGPRFFRFRYAKFSSCVGYIRCECVTGCILRTHMNEC